MITPTIIIAWSPSLVTDDEYHRLLSLLDDLVKNAGGDGLVKLSSTTITPRDSQ